MLFEPLDFISKLAALVPSPRVNLTRFYGVFAPNSRYRSGIIIQLKAKESIEKELPQAERKAWCHDMGCPPKARPSLILKNVKAAVVL
jgi:hypothetical protein